MLESDYGKGLNSANTWTHQDFIPERSASPHPRFLGLAKSIYERRGHKKVKILSPIFVDELTDVDNLSENEPFPG